LLGSFTIQLTVLWCSVSLFVSLTLSVLIKINGSQLISHLVPNNAEEQKCSHKYDVACYNNVIDKITVVALYLRVRMALGTIHQNVVVKGF
jgi:hypothetical protein